jgi:hypothetical protein
MGADGGTSTAGLLDASGQKKKKNQPEGTQIH